MLPVQAASDRPAGVPDEAKWANVDRVVDGDQPYGKQATRALDELIDTKVYVLEKDTDRYGRLVGVLYTPEGLNVNLEMVCGGHAWWYERYARFDSDLEDCQESAQETRLGLWADDDPVAPWAWRRK